MSKKKSTLNIYGCGGCGINLVARQAHIPAETKGYPEVSYTAIDSSSSNLKGLGEHIDTILLPGLDGFGGERGYGLDIVRDNVDRILKESAPGDYNIVVFSLAGGTGSVVGPVIMDELLRRDRNVVAICVDANHTLLAARNSLRSISTLSNISRSTKRPLVASFHMNDGERAMTDVDAEVGNLIKALAFLFSGDNGGLDTRDIHNWLNYHGVTELKPQLSQLVMVSALRESDLDPNYPAMSVASLLSDPSEEPLRLQQPYGCHGYIPAAAQESTDRDIPSMHFIITNGLLGKRTMALQDTIESMAAAMEQMANPQFTIDDEGADTDGDFVL